MSALTEWFRGARSTEVVERAGYEPLLSLNDFAQMLQQVTYQGLNYSLPGATQEEIGQNFRGLASGAYKGNGVVFACCLVRMMLFSEARLQFRRIKNGRPGDLFGTPALAPVESPWAGGTTGDLLSKMIQHADLAGNWFGTSRYGGVTTLRPDWVSIIFGSNNPAEEAFAFDPEAVVLGYAFQPGGPGSGRDPILYLPEEVAHFAPIPDPEAQFRGMSWLTPIIREVMADKAMVEHKITFLESGGTPNMVVKFDINDLTKYQQTIEQFRRDHEGVTGAYRTMFLAAGMDVTTVGTDMKQLDFKVVQGAGETRVAAAAGVPPVIVGLSEGLQGSSLNAGNYSAARRRFSDGTMRPLWRNACGSLATLVSVPGGAELWYDARDVAFLQEDEKDAAEIQSIEAQSMKALVDSGWDPDSVVAAITARDYSLLSHSGLYSVQLQPPGTESPAPEPADVHVIGSNGGSGGRNLDEDTYRILEGFARAKAAPPEINMRVDAPQIEIPAQAAPTVTFERGAIETRVEPADVHVIVESPPPAEPAQIQFVEGAIRVDAAPTPDVHVTVEAPPPADVAVTVEAPAPAEVRVDIAPPPPAEVNVQVDAPPPAEVNMRVEAPPPAEVNVTVERAQIDVQPADVNVTVEPTQIDVHVPENVPAVNVDVRAADQPAPVINVQPSEVVIENKVEVQQPNKRVKFTRGADGLIDEASTEDTDA